MTASPRSRRVHFEPDPWLAKLEWYRSWRSRPSRWLYHLRRFVRQRGLTLLLLAGVGWLCLKLVLSPWPIMPTLKHWAAFPNCGAARSVGLAPARRGEPGYYKRHDADDDGWACEPPPRSAPSLQRQGDGRLIQKKL